MKTALTILFSLALIASQGVFMAASSSGVQPPPNCCCTKCCCVSIPESAPVPFAPAPARAASQTQTQIILVVAAQLLSQPAITAPFPVSAYSTPHFQVDAPLYERNCTYLI